MLQVQVYIITLRYLLLRWCGVNLTGNNNRQTTNLDLENFDATQNTFVLKYEHVSFRKFISNLCPVWEGCLGRLTLFSRIPIYRFIHAQTHHPSLHTTI